MDGYEEVSLEIHTLKIYWCLNGNNHNTLQLLFNWRQDFCESVDYGDVYYDLRKLVA